MRKLFVTLLVGVVAALSALTSASAHSVPKSALKTVKQANAQGPWAVSSWSHGHGQGWLPVLHEGGTYDRAQCHGVGKPTKRGAARVFAHFDCVVDMQDLDEFDGDDFAIVTISFRLHALLGGKYLATGVTPIP
jgi:hypothetical protein